MGGLEAAGASRVILAIKAAITGAFGLVDAVTLYAGTQPTWTFIHRTPLFLIGIVTSAVVGYAAVKYFIRYLANHTLDVFAWYRLGLAAMVVIWIWRR